jgi:hypothetical protein
MQVIESAMEVLQQNPSQAFGHTALDVACVSLISGGQFHRREELKFCRWQTWRVGGCAGWHTEHLTRCFLCWAVKEYDTNLEQIFLFGKSLSKICLADSLPTSGRSASSQVVIRITMARVFSAFSLDRAEAGRLGRGSSSSDPCLLEKARNIKRLVHDSDCHRRTYFLVLVHFRGSFPRFKVKFNHGTLLHVETFNTRNIHTLTPTAKKRQLPWLTPEATDTTFHSLRSANSSGHIHILFC